MVTLTEALNYKSSLKWVVEPKSYEEMIELGKVAAVIDILQREFRELMGRMRELEVEAAALREALAPFANVEIDPDVPDHMTFHVIGQTDYKPLTVKDVRNARQALSTTAGREYAERVRKLETVAKAASNVFKTYFSLGKHGRVSCYDIGTGYCGDCTEKMSRAWEALEKALVALEEAAGFHASKVENK